METNRKPTMETSEPTMEKEPEFQVILNELHDLNGKTGILLEKILDINEGLLGEPVALPKKEDITPVKEGFVILAEDKLIEIGETLDRIDMACTALLQQIR